MPTETYVPTFADIEEIQVLFQTMGDTAGGALDEIDLPASTASTLWLISKLCDTAARDIDHLLGKEGSHSWPIRGDG